jgi:Fur family ferric uptake transcriptional regulator
MARSASEYDVAWAKGVLRAADLRSTASRVAVLRYLASADRPMSHGEIVEALSDVGIDQSTIFRTLQEFAESGLATKLELGDQIRRFELRSTASPNRLEHPHFMCVDCGEVTCLEDFAFHLTPSRGPRRERLGNITEVLLRGHCGNCAAR